MRRPRSALTALRDLNGRLPRVSKSKPLSQAMLPLYPQSEPSRQIDKIMLFSESRYLSMADLLEKKAKVQCDAKKAAKQLARAKVFRLLACKAAQKSRVL